MASYKEQFISLIGIGYLLNPILKDVFCTISEPNLYCPRTSENLALQILEILTIEIIEMEESNNVYI